MGYAGIPTSVAAEFDTFNNGSPTDSDGNHVGIDLNGSVVSVARASIPTRMNTARSGMDRLRRNDDATARCADE
jgi:hypothetical protein